MRIIPLLVIPLINAVNGPHKLITGRNFKWYDDMDSI
jgi:hypothetical protein